jgi:hypothetical protein
MNNLEIKIAVTTEIVIRENSVRIDKASTREKKSNELSVHFATPSRRKNNIFEPEC